MIEKIFQLGEDFADDIGRFMLQRMLRKAKARWAWLNHHIAFEDVRLMVKRLRIFWFPYMSEKE